MLNKTIFKTIKSKRSSKKNSENFSTSNIPLDLKKEITTNVDMKKMMKLMKNRMSARKCRQKKNIYVRNLEEENSRLREELNKYKSIQTNNMKLEYYIEQVNLFNFLSKLNEKEIEIKNNINNKVTDMKSIYDYNQNQQNLLIELFKKILRNIIPIDFKIFSSKGIKLHEFSKDDSLNELINKIKENYEM